MRKKIAKGLLWMAQQLCPAMHVNVFERRHEYEAKVCASAYSIDRNYIRKLKKIEHIKSSREAIALAKKREMEQAKKDVFEAIEKYVMEQRTYKKGLTHVVEVRVNCYVPKEG